MAAIIEVERVNHTQALFLPVYRNKFQRSPGISENFFNCVMPTGYSDIVICMAYLVMELVSFFCDLSTATSFLLTRLPPFDRYLDDMGETSFDESLEFPSSSPDCFSYVASVNQHRENVGTVQPQFDVVLRYLHLYILDKTTKADLARLMRRVI